MSQLNDQDRLTMQRTASAAERRNRPRSLVTLATLVLILAGAYAALGFGERKSSLSSLSAAHFSLQRVQGQLEELESLQAPDLSGGPIIHEMLRNPVSLLERAAQDAEIEIPTFDLASQESVSDTAHRRIFTYKRHRFAQPGDLFRWAKRVEQDIDGMKVHSIDLSIAPDNRGVDATLAFSRLEKKQ